MEIDNIWCFPFDSETCLTKIKRLNLNFSISLDSECERLQRTLYAATEGLIKSVKDEATEGSAPMHCIRRVT